MRFIVAVFVVLLLPGVAAAQMLPQAPTKLIVKSEPGAAVYLDGALVGTVEQNGQLILTLKEADTRQRELRVALAERRPFEQRVTITPYQETQIVAKLSELVGRLEVLTTPEAEVLL